MDLPYKLWAEYAIDIDFHSSIRHSTDSNLGPFCISLD